MQAIVLSRRDFREYDQIISLYTKEEGKLALLARGVKKSTSKNAAHLEPFALNIVEIAKGKEIDHLTKVAPIDFFPAIRQDLAKSFAAGFVVSLIDTMVERGERDERLFASIVSWLRHTEEAPKILVTLVDGFVAVFLAALGFAPITTRCVVCGKPFRDIMAETLQDSREDRRPQTGFYFAGGGLVCGSCRREKERIGEEVFPCGLKEISDIDMLLKADWRQTDAFPLEPEERAALHRLVREFAVYHSERRIGEWGVFLK